MAASIPEIHLPKIRNYARCLAGNVFNYGLPVMAQMAASWAGRRGKRICLILGTGRSSCSSGMLDWCTHVDFEQGQVAFE